MIALLLTLQEIAAEPAPALKLADVTFDLRKLDPSGHDGSILIVGRRANQRLEPLPPGFEPEPGTPPLGRFGSGGFTMDFAPTLMANGTISNRIMFTFKTKF